MDLVHPSKFIQSRKLPSKEVKVMMIELMNLYPSALDDISSAERVVKESKKRQVNSRRSRAERKTVRLVKAATYVKFICQFGLKILIIFARVYFRGEEKARVWFSPQLAPPSTIVMR